jgi:hypothetical protein
MDPDPDTAFDDQYKKTDFFFKTTIAVYLSLGLHKRRPSYRRSLQPPKENIQHFIYCFLFYWVIFTLLDPDLCGNYQCGFETTDDERLWSEKPSNERPGYLDHRICNPLP